MRFIFLVFLFCQITLGLIYNDKCTNKCDLPGMVCVNNRCICDSKTRLFWTSARCAPCPNDWTMTETACIAYYATPSTWEVARSTCRNLQAELISFRNRDLIPLVFAATDTREGTQENVKQTAWVGGYATDLYEGVYAWLDKSVRTFTMYSDWWCRRTTPNLGFQYVYDEPTHQINEWHEQEACVAFWRGISNIPALCLVDRFCRDQFPFMCEKSESTASQYIGPPPKPSIIDPTSGVTTIPQPSNVPPTDKQHSGTVTINPPSAQSKSKEKLAKIIKITAAAIFLLLLLLSGLFFYFKYYHSTKTSSMITEVPDSIPNKSSSDDNDASTKNRSIQPKTNKSEDDGLALTNTPLPTTIGINNIDPKKQQKNKRGGYSTQNFDEFE